MGKLQLLKTDKEFNLFRSSKSFSTKDLKIRVIFANQNNPRFGFIIPKKILPKVVDRNLIKRRMKTALLFDQKKLKPANILIFPYSGLLKKTFAGLRKELEYLFTKANLWK